MKPSVIREMTTEEVEEHLVDEMEALKKLEMQHAISPLENPLLIRSKRRVIARLSTEVTKRRSAEKAEK